MEIKGTALKTTENFVRSKFPKEYERWLNSLTPETTKIYRDGVMIGEWYDLVNTVIHPTYKIAELFYNNDYPKAAFEVGYFSALEALSGIYKIFVKIASIDFVLKRATTIFSTYYKTGLMQLVSNDNNSAVLKITGFHKDEVKQFDRIAGWIKGIYDTISNKNFEVTYEYNILPDNFVEAKMFSKWK